MNTTIVNCIEKEMMVAKIPYPVDGVIRSSVIEDNLISHLIASRESCCGLVGRACPRCKDALILHDQLKKQMGDERT